MRNKILAVFLAALLMLVITGCADDAPAPGPQTTSSFSTPTGTGYLRKSDTLWILNLEGNYTDMGRQYGALLKSELSTMFRQMDAAIGFATARPLLALLEKETIMDPRERQLLGGMATETGMSLDQHEFLNASLFFMYLPGCSAFAATGPQTESHFTIAGRNFDNPKGISDKFSSILKGKSILVIYNPRDQVTSGHRDNSVASMTQIGWFYGLTNLNSKGIYLEYNNATNSIPIDPNHLGIVGELVDGLHHNLYAALDCDTLDQVDIRLSGPAAVANMTQVADKTQVWHFERAPDGPAKKVPAGSATGRVSYDNPLHTDIFTNHFFNNDWGPNQKFDLSPVNDSGSKTFARLINLQNLAKLFSGQINVDRMKTIMTTRLMTDGSGGPFIGWELNNPDVTHFTSVTDIANKVMHIYPYVDAFPYVDNYAAQWAIVDLNKEFR